MALDPKIRAAYFKLKPLREREDLKLKKSSYIKETFIGFDGKERDLVFRYYQIQGVLHLFTMGRFLLGDDCGLGKTLQVIGALGYVWDKTSEQKVVVVTNKSAVGQWCGEFDKFCVQGSLSVIRCQGSTTKRAKAYEDFQKSSGPTVLVVGYGSLRQDFSKLHQWKDLIIVFDEATAFKNPKSQIHQICKHLSANCANRVWCLTATMIKNNLSEGYGIFQVMLAGTEIQLFPGSLSAFYDDYYVMRLQKIGKGKRQIPLPVALKKGSVDRFRQLIDPFFIGRAKHEVAKELPPLTLKVEKVSMTKSQQIKYDEALEGLLEIEKTGETKETTPLTALIYCQQIVNHPELIECEGDSSKLERLIELLTQGDFAEENIIVYTRFRKMVDLMMPVLKKNKVEAVRITGADTKTVTYKGKKVSERDAAMGRFNDPEDKARVCVITDAASEAINLQTAKVIILYDTPWSAGNFLQILGRMIRIGSLHDRVYALHLVAKDSIDERVVEVLRKKMALIEAVLGKRLKGEDTEVEIDSKNDISELFQLLQADAQKRKVA